MGVYLFEKVMEVPGLNGTPGERQRQLYERLGSPMGGYTGSLEQNLWLLNQINSGNVGQAAPMQSAPTPTYTVPTPQAVTPFESVLPYENIFNKQLIQSLAESQVLPEVQRQQDTSMTDYNRTLGGTGGYRSGVGLQGRENISNQYSRMGQEQVADFASNINNYGTDWYNQMKVNYNQQPGLFTQSPLPTFDSFLQANPNLANIYNTQTNTPTKYSSPFNF